ncbi:hypothetical protein EAH75_10520 [Rhodanobacter glycinis]|uniref:DUF4350 domain-containing protein n=1 Tax=Rhodanobacter glycinis TaxID=582702 RepID=UPI001129CBE8|nr:DUF4350 domain-containing protein [Rhodanobacter glycinis]TPG48906.1 hypothetical protein EAH75_10520 [Rhodanobacter glycinis]
MNRKPLYVILLVLAVLLLLVGGFFALFEHKDVSEPAAATGEARFNRFFALEQTLDRLNLPATSLTTLDPQRVPLHPGDTLVLGDDVARVDVDDATRIAAWVRGGGHLLLSPGLPDLAVHTPLFEALGLLDPRPAKYACSAIHMDEITNDKDTTRLCGTRFRLKSAASAAVDAAIGDAQGGYLFARTRVARGSVSLLVNLDTLSRNALKHPAAQQFGWRLLAPNMGNGRVYLVYALDGISFLKMLLRDGWPALLALTLLLAGWMASSSARLGPLMPAPVLHRRALLEHVQAAGEFLYRRDGGRSLHNLACHTVLARLRRRDPACAMFNGDALYARLAERSDLDALQIAQAFQSPANAPAFRASIITLARLRSHS